MSSRDVLFLERSVLGTVLYAAVYNITTYGDKRKRTREFSRIVRVLRELKFLPADKVTGIASGCDSLGVDGIFVILDKTTVQGQPDTVEYKINHPFTPHILDESRCSRCAYSKLDIIHEPKHEVVNDPLRPHPFELSVNPGLCKLCGLNGAAPIHAVTTVEKR